VQRGTKSRPGLVIETSTEICIDCNRLMRCDRWTGEFKVSNPAAGLSRKLQSKILKYYKLYLIQLNRENEQFMN